MVGGREGTFNALRRLTGVLMIIAARPRDAEYAARQHATQAAQLAARLAPVAGGQAGASSPPATCCSVCIRKKRPSSYYFLQMDTFTTTSNDEFGGPAVAGVESCRAAQSPLSMPGRAGLRHAESWPGTHACLITKKRSIGCNTSIACLHKVSVKHVCLGSAPPTRRTGRWRWRPRPPAFLHTSRAPGQPWAGVQGR